MRILSLVVAAGYVVFLLILSGPRSLKEALGVTLLLGASVVFPLLCIWFGDEMGEYVGMLPGPAINKTSPGSLVRAGGWVLLLLPFLVYWLVFRV